MNLICRVFLVFAVLGFCLPGLAQNDHPDKLRKYSGGGFSFSYSDGWKMTDKSMEQVQQLNLVPERGNALIMVFSLRPKIVSHADFEVAKTGITQNYVDKILSSFRAARQTEICTKINDAAIPGFRITGLYKNEESTADIFSFAMSDKFFNLIYLRENKEAAKTDPAWEEIVKSFAVKGKKADKTTKLIIDLDNNAVINSRAVKLPDPIFPSFKNWSNRVIIQVRVTVDEKGDVIFAKAESDLLEFHPAVLQAAKEAKFTPLSLCGEITKFTGIIVYTFERR